MQKIVETNLGYISKAENTQELSDLTDRLGSHFGSLTHFGFNVNLETIKTYFSNPLRFKDCFIYFYFDKNNTPKSFIWWMKNYEARVNKKTLSEYMWASSNPKYSIRILNESIKHINTFYNYDTIVMGNDGKNPRLDEFYLKKGFKVESKSFYKNI